MAAETNEVDWLLRDYVPKHLDIIWNILKVYMISRPVPQWFTNTSHLGKSVSM